MPESIPFRIVIKTMFLSIGFLCLLIYLAFQARYLISGPQIAFSNELDLQQNSRQVFLTGAAYNISHLWLNDRAIYTDAQGNFNEALILENGYTIATLRAEDRYGRETTVTKQLVYVPASFVKHP